MTTLTSRTVERTRQPNFGGLAARWDADVMAIGDNNTNAEVQPGDGAE